MSVQSVRDAVKNFEDVQRKFSSNGAQDPEPHYVFHRLMVKALSNKPYKIPDTADGWELYDNVGSEEAATALHSAAKVVCDELENVTIKDLNQVKRFLGI